MVHYDISDWLGVLPTIQREAYIHMGGGGSTSRGHNIID